MHSAWPRGLDVILDQLVVADVARRNDVEKVEQFLLVQQRDMGFWVVGKGNDTGASRPQLSTLRLPEVEYDSAVGEDGAEACVDDSETHVSLLDEEELLDFFDSWNAFALSRAIHRAVQTHSAWPRGLDVILDQLVVADVARRNVPTSLSPTNETGDFRTAKADRCYGRQTLLLSGDEDARFAGLLCQGFRF
jgi:hypothetical protein